MRLLGKKALITGASKGIGRSVALAYAREGADVFLTAREDKEALIKTIKDAEAFDVKAKGGLYDAASLEKVRRLMDDVQGLMGGGDSTSWSITRESFILRRLWRSALSNSSAPFAPIFSVPSTTLRRRCGAS